MTRLLVAGVLLIASTNVVAANPAAPHPHQGKLAPFSGLPPPPTLSADERAALARGEVIVRPMDKRSDGRRMVTFQVDAPADRVWAVVSRFEAFPSYIDEVKRVSVLQRDAKGTVVAFTVSQLGVTLTYFVRHLYDDERRAGTWTLDYGKESDLDDSVGYWRVTPLPGDPSRCLVEHSTHVALQTPLPGFLQTWIADGSLRSTGAWVRKHSATR